tara:strand:+ start:5194 stop:6192 length:999 start_codon:yes stop_codon:yes gene_type:complete
MACNICGDDYGMSWCECSYLTCPRCMEKYIQHQKKEICPQCKRSIRKNYFLAGKITEPKECRDDFAYNKCRRIVLPDCLIKENGIKLLESEKYGRLNIDKEQIMSYNDFIDLSKSIGVSEFKNEKFNLTGPCVLLNHIAGHGLWGPEQLVSCKKDRELIDIVDKRNYEMIVNCDVFSLHINSNDDCFCSFSEWGLAKELGKILVLYVHDITKYECKEDEALEEYNFEQSIHDLYKNRAIVESSDEEEETNIEKTKIIDLYKEVNKESHKILGITLKKKNTERKKDYYMFAHQSLNSFQALDFTKRDTVLYCHPEIPFNDYRSYEQYLETFLS